MSGLYLGVDTSAYTTSVACVSEEGIVFDRRTVLSVPLGERGLRQSDAVFQHVRNLPALTSALFAAIDASDVLALGVSNQPTADEESYMPVFLAGKAAAAAISGALGVMQNESTHQAGHIRAALYGRETLLCEGTLLALHLSGGTTDLLSVSFADGALPKITRVGRSTDLHAGQFVDRVGVRLGLPFPSGKLLEQLAMRAKERSIKLPSAVKDAQNGIAGSFLGANEPLEPPADLDNGILCSFSGAESLACRQLEGGAAREEIAFAVYDCLARTFGKMIERACQTYGADKVLLAGGVAGSALLRELLAKRTRRELFFAETKLASDNAVGAALLARDAYRKNGASMRHGG